MEQVGSQQRVTGWVGWIVFAATIMIISGGFGLIQGFIALFQDDFFVATEQVIVTFNVTAWGWIHIIFGALLILVGAALLQGSTWARVVAIFVVGLHMIAQFTWASAYPFWAVIIIFVDVLVLWALIVHGGETADAY